MGDLNLKCLYWKQYKVPTC